MKRKHAHDIRRNEQGKDHAGGFAGGQNLGHENDGEQAKGTESGFCQTGT